jgi:hypothetical protein
MGIIIGTAILWGLTAILINPIVDAQLRSRMESEGVYVSSMEQLSVGERAYWDGVATRIYILWDVIILGIAGFLGGYLLGYGLIGISLNVKGWPGMISMIVLSFISAGMRGG